MVIMVTGLSMLQGGLMFKKGLKEAKDAISNLSHRFRIHVGCCMGGKPLLLVLNTTTFNDKSIKVSLDGWKQDGAIYDNVAFIECYLGNMDDVVVLCQIIEVLKRKGFHTRVKLKTTLYARYDRVMHEDQNDAFGLKVFTDILKSSGNTEWFLVNAHSSVFQKLLDAMGYCKSMNSWEYRPNEALKHLPRMLGIKDASNDYYSFVLPDKGAEQRFSEAIPEYVCDKNRDPETGKILGITAEQSSLPWVRNRSDRLLIIDDICENGGTFLGCVKAIRDNDDHRPIDLFVDYGVFPKNTDFTNLAQNIDRLIIGNIEKENLVNLMKYFKGEKRIFVDNVY